MSFRMGFSNSKYARRGRGMKRNGEGQSFMTEKELDAYLVARDTVRRIKRVATFFPLGELENRPIQNFH